MAPFLLANFLATLYFVFYLYQGLCPSYRYGTRYNVARKLAKRNGAIIYANFVGPTLVVVYPSCFQCLNKNPPRQTKKYLSGGQECLLASPNLDHYKD